MSTIDEVIFTGFPYDLFVAVIWRKSVWKVHLLSGKRTQFSSFDRDKVINHSKFSKFLYHNYFVEYSLYLHLSQRG